MTNWAEFAAIEVPLLTGVGAAGRAYVKESFKSWRQQNPEDAAALDARKAEKARQKQNRNLNTAQFGRDE